MSIANDLITKLKLGFIEKAVVRELEAMLMHKSPAGEIPLDVPGLAEEWKIEIEIIWRSIQALEGAGFWHTESGLQGETLVCKVIKDSSKAIGKSKKKAALAGVRSQAIEQRAMRMTLADADPGRVSALAEVVEQIPYEMRFIKLREPYQGWLPSDRYAAAGMTFKPAADLIAKLKDQFQAIDIDLALALMYEDLRECPQERPSIAAFRYWMPTWITKNSERLASTVASNAATQQLDEHLDDY